MKKLLLSLGALSAVVAPVAAVVACGSKTETPAKHDQNQTAKATSTFTQVQLDKVKIDATDNPASIQTKLGLNQTPMAATGATYTWDSDALTLTTTSTTSGVTLTQVITVTPAISLKENIEKLNSVLSESVKKTVADSLAKNPLAGKYDHTDSVTKKEIHFANAKDWNVEFKIETEGFVMSKHYSKTKLIAGYKQLDRPIITYHDASMGGEIYFFELSQDGINELFNGWAKGGLSLSNVGKTTAWSAQKTLLEEFLKDNSDKLSK